jgi:hypothetical protein
MSVATLKNLKMAMRRKSPPFDVLLDSTAMRSIAPPRSMPFGHPTPWRSQIL